MDPDSTKFTSFISPLGQYELTKMGFGLKNAPAVFQRFIHEIFRDMIDENRIVIYMDDIMIATETFDAHRLLLKEVLDRCCRRGLQLNLKKSQFCFDRLIFLGYLVSAAGISLTDDRISAIKNYPLPTDNKSLLSCLCLFNYFRRFVKDFSLIAAPLQARTKDTGKFVITDEYQRAFEQLRNSLTESPVLIVYHPERETQLHCDASSRGFGACLMQKRDGSFHPVAYFSQRTSVPESSYHSFVLETLGVIKALRHFDLYLRGIPFTIITDCDSLKLTLAKKQVNALISRWSNELQYYNYKIDHRPGKLLPHVDALSRCHPVHDFITSDRFSLKATPAPPPNKDPPTDSARLSMVNELDDEFIDDIPPCDMISVLNPADVEERLAAAQARDPSLLTLRKRLENESVAGFRLHNGLIFKNSPEGTDSLYVPIEMEENVIRLAHEMVGHQALEKTKCYLRRHYWMPRLTEKIQKHIDNCLECIMYASPVRIAEKTLQMIPKAPTPFDTLHIDHFGPLPAVTSKRKYILAVINAFTKFVRLYPVNSTSTKEVNASLDKYFSYYSRPRRIISDRGSCFTSNEFQEFLLKRNVAHVRVATAAPWANGQAERTMRQIKSMLGKLTEPTQHSNWTAVLGHAEFAINNARHATTGASPAEMLFGTRQRGPRIDRLTEHLDEAKEINAQPQREDRLELRAAAAENIRKAQEYAASRHTRRFRPARKYAVGDFVVIRNVDSTAGSNKKLIPTFRGPYVVHKELGNDRYVIRDIENCQQTQLPYDGVLEASRLRLWVDLGEDIVDNEFCLATGSSPLPQVIEPTTDDQAIARRPASPPQPTNPSTDALTTTDDSPRPMTQQKPARMPKPGQPKPALPAATRTLRPLPHRTKP